MLAYSPKIDYQKVINESVARGDYENAAKAEQLRNAKIVGEGLNYAQTSNYSSYLPTSNTGGRSSGGGSGGGSGNSKAEATEFYTKDGGHYIGYIIDDLTYTDPEGKNRVPMYAIVKTEGGWYERGPNGSTRVEDGLISSVGVPKPYPQSPPSYGQHDSTFDDFYEESGYDAIEEANRRALEAYIEQAMAGFDMQRMAVNQEAEELARQAYVAYMQSMRTLPQALAAAGYSGGMADSQKVALQNAFTNNQNKIALNRQNALLALDSAAASIKNQATLEAAQQQSAVAQAAVEAWNAYKRDQAAIQNADYWNQMQLDFNRMQYESDQKQTRKNAAYMLTLQLLDSGVMPDDETLNSAGISKEEAQAYINNLNHNSAGASGASYSSSSGSGGGSGSYGGLNSYGGSNSYGGPGASSGSRSSGGSGADSPARSTITQKKALMIDRWFEGASDTLFATMVNNALANGKLTKEEYDAWVNGRIAG